MISLFGTSMSGSNLLYEMMTGSYERVLATPLDRSAILVGRSLKEFAPLVVQGLLIALVCVPFGFTLYPLHLLVGLLLLGLFGIGVGALSIALALAAKNREWLFWGVQQSLLFPLLILSGMMLPLRGRAGVDADRGALQPAHLHRRRRARAARRVVRGPRRAVGLRRGGGDVRRRAVGRYPPHPQDRLTHPTAEVELW